MSLFVTTSDDVITSREQLSTYFRAGEKPKSDWLIGCEHEKFPFRLGSLKPVAYDEPNGLHDFMKAMRDFGWKEILDNGNIIGLTRGKAAITFEPAGQVELSGAPLQNLHEVSSEIDQHLSEACEVGEALGIGFLGLGFHPTATRDELQWIPKSRYKIMRAYMPKVGTMGLDMMLRSCSVQVNLDYASEADMVKKFRVSLALQPIATALFAASPFKEDKPSGFLSTRMHAWTDTDKTRSGSPQFIFDDGFGYDQYAKFALSVPMYYAYRDGQYIDCTGQSFQDFIDGKLPMLPGVRATMGDWANHLATIFTDVRLKNILEMRSADTGPSEMLLALPSLWVGLLYDENTLDAAWDLVKDWTAEDRMRLNADAPRLALQADVRGRFVYDIAQEVLVMAKTGLRRRAQRLHGGADETRYLDVLFGIAESRSTIADQLMMHYNHTPNYSVKDVYSSCRLLPPPPAERLEA